MVHLEIERRYRIISWSLDAIRLLLEAEEDLISQGFISDDPTVRIRLYEQKKKAVFTTKTKAEGFAPHQPMQGFARYEDECEISYCEGQELMKLAKTSLRKIRFTIGRYEIDIFFDALAGLEILEIELTHENEDVALPEGLEVEEITHDPRYLNVNLAKLESLEELLSGTGGSLAIHDIKEGLDYCEAKIRRVLKNKEEPFVVIGVSGASASGKSSRVSRGIVDRFGPDAAVLDLDSYFVGKKRMQEARVDIFDDPRAVDLAQAASDVLSLIAGLDIQKPIYSFETGEREGRETFSSPAKVLIVEGIFALHPMLRNLFDFSIFVDVSAHGALWRRIKRDAQRTSFTAIETLDMFVRETYPGYKTHIEYQRSFADLVIHNDMNPEEEMQLEEGRETQVKVRLDKDYLTALAVLAELGFQEDLSSVVLQHDSYLRAQSWSIPSSNELVRIRREYFADDDPVFTLTYKGPQDGLLLNTRGSVQFEIPQELLSLLETLGYKKWGDVIKHRTLLLNEDSGVTVALDRVSSTPAATFLEIRGSDRAEVEEIVRAMQERGVSEEYFTDRPYVELALV